MKVHILNIEEFTPFIERRKRCLDLEFEAMNRKAASEHQLGPGNHLHACYKCMLETANTLLNECWQYYFSEIKSRHLNKPRKWEDILVTQCFTEILSKLPSPETYLKEKIPGFNNDKHADQIICSLGTRYGAYENLLKTALLSYKVEYNAFWYETKIHASQLRIGKYSMIAAVCATIISFIALVVPHIPLPESAEGFTAHHLIPHGQSSSADPPHSQPDRAQSVL